MNKKKNRQIIISIIIPLVIGFIGGLFGNIRGDYQSLTLPSFAPPAILFPIVWTILYVLMGFASYLIYQSNDKDKKKALWIYVVQLIVNALWTFIFATLQARLLAFYWILLLIVLVVIMFILFYKIDKKASFLILPYFIWLLFAAVLNYQIYLLN